MTANPVDLLAITLTWWIVSLSGVLAPGPLITSGHAIAELGVVVALALGLDQTLKQPPVLGTIGLLGGIVLCWMGIGMVKTARALVSGRSSGARLGVDVVSRVRGWSRARARARSSVSCRAGFLRRLRHSDERVLFLLGAAVPDAAVGTRSS